MQGRGGSRAQQRLTLLALALLAVGGLLLADLHATAGPGRPLPLPVAAVGVLLFLAELGRMHIEVRRSAITVTLSDAALIVALFTIPPAEAVLLRLVACAPVLMWLYRRSMLRLSVNTAMMVFESTACATALQLFSAGSPTSPRSWLVVGVAVQVSGLLAGLVVNLAITLNGDTESLREVVAGLTLGAGVSGATSILGIIGITLTAAVPAGRWLLLAATTVGLLVYRGYARLLERKAALEAVHAFGRSLDTDAGTSEMLRTVLEAVPDLVGAARAELVFGDNTGAGHTRAYLEDGTVRLEEAGALDWPVRRVLETAQPLGLGRHSRHHSVRELLRTSAVREMMIAPLPTDAGAGGALLAIDRLGQVRGFRRADLILLETLALHAGVALQNVGLVDQLRHDIRHDRLTGLLNRQGLDDAIPHQGVSGVLLIQLNNLQDVNDALGHAACDSLLVAAASRLQAGVRDDTPTARIEHDIFAVLLTNAGEDTASALGERLLTLVADPLEVNDVPVSLTAAVGLALGGRSEDLIRRAEIALRAARGRDGGLRFYKPGMEPPSARRLSVAAELRQVLADSELSQQVVVHYQPKADLKTGAVHAVEALVRWQHPDRGLVPPIDFIPVIETTDLVRPLTMHVLNTALGDAWRWQAFGRTLGVAVNLSARSLYDTRLATDIMTLLSQHRVAPELLTLEITESAVMDDPDRARDTLEQLAALGISISVDDFGTGHSSLAYLARLPVDEVKVDRMFVSRMTRDRRDATVVRSVVDLGHSLGLRVVAEGVEDSDCWDALVEIGADVAQGFLLSRPLRVEALQAWLDARDTSRVVADREATA